MSIEFKCPKCKREYSVNEKYVGKKLKCKNENCATMMQVPERISTMQKKKLSKFLSIIGIAISVVIVAVITLIYSLDYENITTSNKTAKKTTITNNLPVDKIEDKIVDTAKSTEIPKEMPKDDTKVKETIDEKSVNKIVGFWTSASKIDNEIGVIIIFLSDGTFVSLDSKENGTIGKWQIEEDYLFIYIEDLSTNTISKEISLKLIKLDSAVCVLKLNDTVYRYLRSEKWNKKIKDFESDSMSC